MKIFGIAQGNFFPLFCRIVEEMQQIDSTQMVGVAVSDMTSYNKAVRDGVFTELKSYQTVLEWDIAKIAKNKSPDYEAITKYELKTGCSIWQHILADRRIAFGKYCKRVQDYQPHLSQNQQLSIASVTISELEAAFDQSKPDIVMGFGSATLLDIVGANLAAIKGIPYLQLKSTKIENRVSFNNTVEGLSQHIRKRISGGIFQEQAVCEAIAYIDRVRTEELSYEGAIDLDKKSRSVSAAKRAINISKATLKFLLTTFNTTKKLDPQYDGIIVPALLENIVQPWRKMRARNFMASKIVNSQDLTEIGEFLFFPLHFEPEVSIQIFGRPYQNQIEVIRQLAYSLPHNVSILVKEHPRALGFRPSSYYKRLSEIPNVRFIDTFTPSSLCVAASAGVAVISGTIGLEAVIRRKPLFLIGRPSYCELPESHVTIAGDPWEWPQRLKKMLSIPPSADDRPVIEFLAASIEGSVQANLYTKILKKGARVQGMALQTENEAISYIATHALQRIEETLLENQE